MWKDKVYRSPKIFHFGPSNGICRFCKMFCCTKCRDRHVDKVHPNVNADCPLYASEILPIRQYESTKLNLEDEKLLCHVVDKHLPLFCRLCGDLFKSKEDFKSIAACKWFERHHCLTSPIANKYPEKKSKQRSISDSDCNGSRFCTPSKIYRQTSTPMLLGEKEDCELLCVPKFSLKTPRSNSSSIAQIASISKTQTSDTQFFSFVLHSSNEDMTPFRTGRDEQFFRTDFGKKLSIMEEQDKIVNNDAEKITTKVIEIWSPVNMDLTNLEGGILQDSPKLDDVCEDVVKEVRFSDQHKTAAEFGNLMEFCVRTILNKSMEENEFHSVYNVFNAQKAKATAEGTEDAKNTMDGNSVEDAKNTNDSQAEDKKRSSIQSSDFLNEPKIRIIQDNTKNLKENRDPEVSSESSLITNQQDSNKVLVKSNSGDLTNDLMPMINSGLKQLQEQFISANCQSPSNTAKSTKVCRRSMTMKMSVSSVESYSASSAETMTNHGKLMSSSSPSIRSDENNGGFLSAIIQTMKHLFRSLSVPGLRVPRSIETTEVIQRREIVEESLPGPSSDTSNGQLRSGKRSREIGVPSKEDPIAFVLDIKSPLVKNHRRWYKMIKGRPPINRMRNSRVTTSPRGVSTETQVFSQGSLTVGDTILPLPARAHQTTE